MPLRRIGVISDTHGLLRPAALTALAGSDLILHAGDVGEPAEEILSALRAIAPVVAVRGNIDQFGLAASLPATAAIDANGSYIYMLHDLHDLEIDPGAAGFALVVSGHSHKPGQTDAKGVTYLNPGSAGPRRFRLPISLARIDLTRRPWAIEFVTLAAD